MRYPLLGEGDGGAKATTSGGAEAELAQGSNGNRSGVSGSEATHSGEAEHWSRKGRCEATTASRSR